MEDFIVEDSGFGIKEEDKGKLFKLYGKLRRNDSNSHGIGLGLTIANMIVCSLNDVESTIIKIKLKSEVNNGSEFSFDFPVQKINNLMRNEVLTENEIPMTRINEAQRMNIDLISSIKKSQKILVMKMRKQTFMS